MKGIRLAATAALLFVVAACSGDDVVGPSADDAQTLEARKRVPRSDTGTTVTPTPSTSVNPFAGATFYVDPYSNARKQVTAWESTRPLDRGRSHRRRVQNLDHRLR